MAVERGGSVVLLHGAGLGSWVWTKVKPQLRLGAEAIDLPGRGPGENPGAVSLRECTDYLVTLLMARDEPSVVVAHSFSSQVAMLAAAEHPERVRAVVLVGGVLPESGRSLLSIFPQPGRFLLGIYLRLARAGVRLPAGLSRKQYGGGLDPAEADMVVQRLVPEARGMYLDRVHWQKLPPSVLVVYVKLLNDAAIPPKQQDLMARRAGATRIETIDAGHLPMISHPSEMAEIIERVSRQVG
jgi:pimeloyl-ACP methyl ester carboxylesterase